MSTSKRNIKKNLKWRTYRLLAVMCLSSLAAILAVPVLLALFPEALDNIILLVIIAGACVCYCFSSLAIVVLTKIGVIVPERNAKDGDKFVM